MMLDFAAVTSFFNPAKFSSRKRNYDIFRNHLRLQNVPLLTVEVSFGSDRPELDGDDVAHVRTGSILWQKEASLNLAIRNLPPSVEYVAWVDSDVIFLNENWAEDSIRALRDRFKLVQPFAKVARLPSLDGNSVSDPVKVSRGFAAGLNSVGYFDFEGSLQLTFGETGFAWVARRELLETNKLYSGAILGGGDLLMAYAAVGAEHKYPYLSSRQRQHFIEWSRPFYEEIRKKVTYCLGTLCHLHHGSLVDRQYNSRHDILLRHGFDPYEDICISETNVVEWCSTKQALHKECSNYFLCRKEDD